MSEELSELKKQYEKIKQPNLDKVTIKAADIAPLIEQLPQPFQVTEVGRSFEGRALNKIVIGSGPQRLFFWSQMHGNEPTATAALFDLFNYIQSTDNQEWVASWQDKLTLQFAPMINPDGAEVHSRHNAMSIDINRDAMQLQSPEGQILKQLTDDFKPHFGFNLHDQNRYYTVAGTDKPTTISLLAPAYNEAKEINETRHMAMQLGALFNTLLQQLIPDCVGRYDDTYSYRSFGDYSATKDIATLLIESGFSPNDPTRQTARWLNFMMLVSAINAIANEELWHVSTDSYNAIPMNHSDGLVDIMLRNVTINGSFNADISVNLNPLYQDPIIEEIGDLSNQTGIEEFNFSGYRVEPIKGYLVDSGINLDEPTYLNLLTNGYSYFIGDAALINNTTDWPIQVYSEELANQIPTRQQPISLILSHELSPKLACINGEWIDLTLGKKVRYSDNFSIIS